MTHNIKLTTGDTYLLEAPLHTYAQFDFGGGMFTSVRKYKIPVAYRHQLIELPVYNLQFSIETVALEWEEDRPEIEAALDSKKENKESKEKEKNERVDYWEQIQKLLEEKYRDRISEATEKGRKEAEKELKDREMKKSIGRIAKTNIHPYRPAQPFKTTFPEYPPQYPQYPYSYAIGEDSSYKLGTIGDQTTEPNGTNGTNRTERTKSEYSSDSSSQSV